MTITITAFADSPDRGRGLARDMRVRWALEEVGQPYEVRLVPWSAFKAPAHLARNPFGQIPTYEEGDLTLFESGAIVFHIAERFPGLLPEDANARARAIMWMFAALSTVEPPIVDRDIVEYFEDGKSWQGERFAMVDERIRGRLNELSAWLKYRAVACAPLPLEGGGAGVGAKTSMQERTAAPHPLTPSPSRGGGMMAAHASDFSHEATGDADWLDGAFSAADILMVHVLRRLEGSGLLEEYPNLAAYIARAEARPAYKRAFAAQLAVFTGKATPR